MFTSTTASSPKTRAYRSVARTLDPALSKGSSTIIANDVAALLGGGLALDGERDPVPHGPVTMRLVRRAMPGGRPYFESTPVVDVSVWRPLQMQRVRYFAKPKPAPSPSASANP